MLSYGLMKRCDGESARMLILFTLTQLLAPWRLSMLAAQTSPMHDE